MKYFLLTLSLSFFIVVDTVAQDSHPLPYEEIPAPAETYNAGTVISRLIDGLGYRYYWATEGLTPENLTYRPTPEARSMAETLDHIYGLSETIVNAPQNIKNIRPADWSGLSFEEKRQATLENLKKASALVKEGVDGDMANYQVIFQRGENIATFPYWNMINGPIADALYHTGQIVTFRRSAGNPIHPGVNVFMGKTNQ